MHVNNDNIDVENLISIDDSEEHMSFRETTFRYNYGAGKVDLVTI